MTYASTADTSRFGEYRIANPQPPLYRFDARVGTELPATPGRYHLYAGWFCPWAQRVVITLSLAGLTDVVGVSYVHGERDGRGWAFRVPTGPDPVNGFTVLREAYTATDPDFDGHISVPTLWDREQHRIASNRFDHLDLDLATAFRDHRSRDLYPAEHAGRIDELEAWLLPALNQGVGAARTDPAARERLATTLADLDSLLATSQFLVGDRVSLADVRVIPTLLRYDASVGRPLTDYPHLWRYARRVYQLPQVAATTDFSAYPAYLGPTGAGSDRPDWNAPLD